MAGIGMEKLTGLNTLVFSSLEFLFRYLPFLLLVFFLVPNRFKPFAMFSFSVVLYALGDPKYVLLLLGMALVNYLFGRGVSGGSGKWLAAAVSCNAGLLAYFKLSNAFDASFLLPVGISFYTFQTMSYSIDVYRGAVKAERNLLNFATFVCLFPQLIAGPIVKYSDINEELHRRRITSEDLEQGARIFLLGLGSKVLLANQIGQLWDEMAAIGYERLSMPLAWLGILAYALQIYFDFSGYSLMAIGLGRLLGFKFPENFRFPYASRSITEFWRRWHITLGSWFREYLYIPLGGNRKGKYRTIFNLFVVWAATGFWHGASWNFVLWGLFFFVFLVLEKSFLLPFLEKHRIFSHCYLSILILISWVLFAVTDFSSIGVYFSRMFSFQFSDDILYYLRNYGLILALAIFFSIPACKRIGARLGKYPVLRFAGMAAILLFSTAYLVDATYNPFLYFRF